MRYCQYVWTRSYQHQDIYIERDNIWYQHKDGNAWYRPGTVICQRGNKVYFYCNDEVRIVAVCRAKPYELERDLKLSRKKKRKEEDEDSWNKWIEEDENKGEKEDKIIGR